MYESNEIVGNRQLQTAKNLYNNAQLFLNGNNMTINVSSCFTSTKRNGTADQVALGYRFVAGTTDGLEDFDFNQSEHSANPFW
ncbi:unnamed protein product [Adineta steineri]|uniref:Neutral/alkaline non-lysosomal ceramidase N-terminal domain-containing protein n=1 Tax=Adineta steineri TaxID=433720 RepID=A0A816G9V1_9BILA|nr:unnamed protein product [Adineta steineri]CAF1672014.1 unnamed protein product [Adineta steineri]